MNIDGSKLAPVSSDFEAWGSALTGFVKSSISASDLLNIGPQRLCFLTRAKHTRSFPTRHPYSKEALGQIRQNPRVDRVLGRPTSCLLEGKNHREHEIVGWWGSRFFLKIGVRLRKTRLGWSGFFRSSELFLNLYDSCLRIAFHGSGATSF